AGAQAEIAAVSEIIRVDEQNLRLVQVSASAGRAAGTEVLAAEGQLANDRALLPPLRQQLDAARHALAVLVGHTPADWSCPDFRFDNLELPAELPLTLPSEWVRHRPDIVAAESQLHAASAAVGVATAQLYPSLTLTGSWSASAAGTAELFDPASRIWSVAAGLTAPLLHGGTLRAQRRAAIATFQAQLQLYRRAVLVGFGQVADALSALQHDAEAIEAQQAALEASTASLELSRQAYEAGQASFIDLLEAQRLFQQARLGLARVQSARFLDTANYFLSMGGDAVRH
ncbi:MAG: efflux transporter outer membrane subunit, partial [Proteobacteria bacterium]|nr:efflux transporter outer membrane subunit [Pseudomonadota bacterium]